MRKRKRKVRQYPLQRCLVSLNPKYYQGLPDSLLSVLPAAQPDSPTQTWGVQEQSDSGDFLLFFMTRWPFSRDVLAVTNVNFGLAKARIQAGVTPNGEVIVAVMNETSATYTDPDYFMATYGHDIEWWKLKEIEWRAFEKFTKHAFKVSILESCQQVGSAIKYSDTIFVGDRNWLSPEVQTAVENSRKL